MSAIPYKGYLIHPAPLKLIDSEEWTIEICISKHRSDSVTERKYSAGNIFKTREEAIQHCINFGKKIIDGDSEHCTVTDL
jgi:hypothetical protein